VSIGEPVLRVRNLRVSFPTRRGTVYAVNGIDLEVGRGQAVGIVGESGSGKSTAVMAATRLLGSDARVAADVLRFDGRDLLTATGRTVRELRGSRIGFVFQNPMTSLDPVFPVGDQLTEVHRFHRRSRSGVGTLLREAARTLGIDGQSAWWRRVATDALKGVGVPDPGRAARSYPYQLSGGMRQRAMIASAVALEPSLLVADEPTTALDVTVQAQILALMDEQRARLGTSLILVSHDLSVVSQHCDTVNVMYAGKIVERGTSAELFASPRHPYTVGLLRAIPKFESRSTGSQLQSIPGSPPDLTQQPVGCPFAPRCERAIERCATVFPSESVVTADSHSVWCHNPW
jgi:oligopeptide/dipeptide ABC transporter ATP-binding protein